MSNEYKMREECRQFLLDYESNNDHHATKFDVWKEATNRCAAIKDAEIARLTNELNSERNKHAELQARCFDQGGTFSSVFDKEHLPTNKTAIEERIVSDDIEQAKMHGEGVARSIQGLLEQLREYKKGATFWRTAYFELQEVKEAEIAAKALMIKELREALKNTSCRTDGDGKDCWCTEMQSGLFKGSHAKWCLNAREVLAKSEHHNPRST